MAISTGGDVAIVLVSILALAVVAAGVVYTRRRQRQWKERQHAQMASRELDLDFDTSDLEIGPTKSMHVRTLSDSSDAPLMKSKGSLRSPSIASFDSGIYPAAMHAFTAQPRTTSPEPLLNPFELPPPAPSKPAIPIIKQPSPPMKHVRPSSLTTAEHQLTHLVSRPSFLTRPRHAPQPSGGVRRARSRGAQDLRSTMLTRLASTRSRRSRSVDAADDEADSPSSVYSQATTVGYRSSVDFSTAFISNEPIPPVPVLPAQYQKASHVTAGGGACQGTPGPAGSAETEKAGTPLEDSHAFPLPVVEDDFAFEPSFAPRTPSAQWFSTLWTRTDSPSSTVPSPSHSPGSTAAPHSSVSDVLSMRSIEVARSMPQYSMSLSPQEGQKGTVGYQLPPNWRSGQAAQVGVVSHVVPHIVLHESPSSTPKASRPVAYAV